MSSISPRIRRPTRSLKISMGSIGRAQPCKPRPRRQSLTKRLCQMMTAVIMRGMRAPKIIEGPFHFVRKAEIGINAKLPELFRGASFSRAEIDEEQRVIPVVFATETPVDRWFGREVLVCTPDACDTKRANKMGAFLSEHNRDQQIGVIVEDSIVFGSDRTARAKLRFSKSKPKAQEEWQDVLDGIRGLISVGYN